MSVVRSGMLLALGTGGAMGMHLITVRVYAQRLQESDLALYFVTLATIALLNPLVSLSVNDGVSYYSGKHRDDVGRRFGLLLTTLLFYAAVFSVLLASILLLPEFFSNLFYSESGLGSLAAIAVFLGMTRSAFDSFFRSMTAARRTVVPAILFFMTLGVLPVVVVLIGYPAELNWLLLETAVATITLWSTFLIVDLYRNRDALSLGLFSVSDLSAMLKYGVPRLPAVLGILFLLSTPVLLAQHSGLPETEVVVIGAGMAVLRMLGLTNQLMTYTLLPRITWAKEHAPEVLARVMWLIIAVALVAGLGAAATFIAVGDVLLAFWLDWPLSAIDGQTIWLWGATLPLIVVYFLRPTVDALHVKAHNTVNVAISVCVAGMTLAFSHFVLQSSSAIGIGVFTGLLLLSLLSVRSVLRLTEGTIWPRIDFVSPSFWMVVLACGAVVTCAWFIRAWAMHAEGVQALAPVGVMGLAVAVYGGVAALVLRQTQAKLTAQHHLQEESASSS